MKLIILESPGKIKTVMKCVPEGYEVMACFGHIMEIPANGININIEDGSFEPNICVMPSKKDLVDIITNKSKEAEEVYICTDPDREGERIAFDVSLLVENKEKIKRAEFHEITKKAILEAIKNPRQIDLHRVNSQMARQILDRLIGYLVSPMMWNRVPGGKSAGRVQSVALRLVAERELEIEAFKSEKFWDMPIAFKIDDKTVWGIVKTREKNNRILDFDKAKKAKELIEKSTATVKAVQRKEMRRAPQPPFDTAGLEKAASSSLGWASKKTMEIAQSLYEQGSITYHRTDSYAVSDDAHKMCHEWIKSKFGEEYLPSQRRVYDKKSLAQEAHECIRPTSLLSEDWVQNAEAMSDEEKKLLELIRNRFIASQMQDVVHEKTVVEVSAGPCVILIEGKMLKFDGWTKMINSGSKDVILPNINEGETLQISEVQIKQHETRPPERYNDGSLIDKMEKEGVGRPSTWATILDNLVARNYIALEGKNFVLTDIGRSVYWFLMGKFSECFMDIKYTSKVEEELDKISQGKADKLQVIKEFYSVLDGIIYKERNETWADLFG